MAVYFLNMKTFGRSNGSSAVGASAYRAGERFRDERTGRMYDHSERQDVMYKEILLPGKFADDEIVWAKDRATLWNAAEAAETRKNARVAREYLVALPVELSPRQRIELVRGFSQELSDRYGFAMDIAVHAPRDFPGSDPRNFHGHLLATTREANIDGLGAKTTLDMNDARRRELGLKPAVYEWLHVRERWATVTNEALEEARVAARVDHRSLQAQHVDREPRLQIPRAAFEMERQGYRSVVAERLREEYENRVRARAEKSAAAEPAAPESSVPGHRVWKRSAGRRGKAGCASKRAGAKTRARAKAKAKARARAISRARAEPARPLRSKGVLPEMMALRTRYELLMRGKP
jgi:ATP-dependent exoDNAse (exonuclease V) alpha subunit